MGKRIGLTGGIGAGKSAVSARLKSLGAMVLDADAYSREAVKPGTEGLKRLFARYGEQIINPDGTLNRPALAGIIFSSNEERKAVNALLHPLVIQAMLDTQREFLRQCKDAPVFFEAALLIEAGMQALMDELWLVTADEDIRVRRVMRRDNCTEAQARARIQSQMPIDALRMYADQEIDNSLGLDALHARVDALYAALLNTK